MNTEERAVFERNARESILLLALQEVLTLHSRSLGAYAEDGLILLEHRLMADIKSPSIPEHLAAAVSSAMEDAITIIRGAFDGAHERCGTGMLIADRDKSLPQAA